MIFQDPYSSLNPRLTVRALLSEVLRFHKVASGAELGDLVTDLIAKVGLRPEAGDKFPHEFSGGQRQRIGIARALALRPEFVVADEPVSALDVSIQAQVLNLMMDLKEEFGLTLLFVSHDLKVIEHFCDRVLVMYLGYVMEEVRCEELHEKAVHPYTRALLGANPINDPAERRPMTVLQGDVPSPYDPPPGCPSRAGARRSWTAVTRRCRRSRTAGTVRRSPASPCDAAPPHRRSSAEARRAWGSRGKGAGRPPGRSPGLDEAKSLQARFRRELRGSLRTPG